MSDICIVRRSRKLLADISFVLIWGRNCLMQLTNLWFRAYQGPWRMGVSPL